MKNRSGLKNPTDLNTDTKILQIHINNNSIIIINMKLGITYFIEHFEEEDSEPIFFFQMILKHNL